MDNHGTTERSSETSDFKNSRDESTQKSGKTIAARALIVPEESVCILVPVSILYSFAYIAVLAVMFLAYRNRAA